MYRLKIGQWLLWEELLRWAGGNIILNAAERGMCWEEKDKEGIDNSFNKFVCEENE